MFKQVLHDPVFVVYDSYVTSLMSYLHEAQRHAIKEQDKKAEGYNRKVKGTYLNVGARVRIANKGKRGKKKLVDTWEPTVYTVMNSNPQTHTSWKMTRGKRRWYIVTLSCISFLPIETADGDLSGTEDSLDASEDECQMEDLVDYLKGESSEDRTRAVLTRAQESASNQTCDGMYMDEDQSDTEQVKTCCEETGVLQSPVSKCWCITFCLFHTEMNTPPVSAKDNH
ncbi:uncharacterized protein LOC133636671 [Entelurus aequoreus]|uniref:uncharacterized protein LOC133636671 n=1 Tax=Entelurus aequoreus TaxID=161455 RepID=UPI002B1D265B|nr:uncharacterized protein LOC133636671 [Entelurus aequoreus]XP_061886412.1 uncharacterized protein LOC133636671 [Entelurus aequoreus]